LRKLGSKNRPGTAVSRKGNDRVDQIIRAARDTLIRAGYQGFTMRAVAAECEISVGNLNYYYASKADLLADLLEIVIQGYLTDFDDIISDSDPRTPAEALEGVIRFIIADLAPRKRRFSFLNSGRLPIMIPVHPSVCTTYTRKPASFLMS